VADQLEFCERSAVRRLGAGGLVVTFVELRRLAGAHLRSHADEFAPFLGLEAGSPEFIAYCEKVESVSAAEWGGQVELRALAACLERQIHVYDSAAPLIVMGEEFTDATPLKVTYHRHYFSLGEHYNSVRYLEEADGAPG